jgi:predicted dehydrogenase
MFAEWLKANVFPGAITAIAEPNIERLRSVSEIHSVPVERQFRSWSEMLGQPRLADILINTTMDRDHADSAVSAMRAGYHMLLEKPMATSLADCARINGVRQETNRIVSVCHSLRYHAVYTEVRRILRSGTIGEVVSLDQMEAVENVHQSHSFVRGNWGNEGRSAFMLLAKSCHDLDIIADLIDRDCVSANSYGSLFYFRPENQPEGAPDRCVEGCPVEEDCPYSALKIYNGKGWSHHTGLGGLTPLELREHLKTSPFGRCVFKTDNDVVDHQVVSMEFDGGVTATFTMTAFTPWGGRYLRVHGTKGYLEAKIDQRTIDVYEFWARNKHSHIVIEEEHGDHGGADATVIKTLMNAVAMADPALVLTTTIESLRSHAVVFAAERSRRERRQVSMAEILEEIQGVYPNGPQRSDITISGRPATSRP